MTRPLIVATAVSGPSPRCYLTAVAFAAVLLGGCGVVCRGPGCEDDWDLGRLLVVRGAETTGSADAIDAAEGSWLGSEDQGSDWQVAARGSTMWVGLPGISSVAVIEDGAADADLGDATMIRTDDSAFGAALGIAETGSDGDPDLWVGAPDLLFSQGGVFRQADVRGSADGELVIKGASYGDRFGAQLAVCGDLDGDALPDVLIAAPWFAAADDFPLADPASVPSLGGAAFLLLTTQIGVGAPGEPWTMGRMWWGAGEGDALGAALVCDRDLDGDGVVDLAIGAPYAGSRDEGTVYVLPGGALPESGPVADRAAHAVVGSAGSWLGTSLATLRPFASGAAWLLAGAPGADGGAGTAWILSGFGGAEPVQRATVDPGAGAAGFHLGREVAAGDTDGDGVEDLLVGAPDWKDGKNGYDAGRLFVWYGDGAWSGTLAVSAADRTLTASQPFARVGRALVAHDLDGDGADDLLLPTRTAALP